MVNGAMPDQTLLFIVVKGKKAMHIYAFPNLNNILRVMKTLLVFN